MQQQCYRLLILCLLGPIRRVKRHLNFNLRFPEINELCSWRAWVIFGRVTFVIFRLQFGSKEVHNTCICA